MFCILVTQHKTLKKSSTVTIFCVLSIAQQYIITLCYRLNQNYISRNKSRSFEGVEKMSGKNMGFRGGNYFYTPRLRSYDSEKLERT